MSDGGPIVFKGKKDLQAKLRKLKGAPLTKPVETKVAKTSDAEIEQRVNEVANLLLVGHTRSDIQRYASKWMLSKRQADEYIYRARAYIKEINDLQFADNVAMVTNQLWDVYRESRRENDRKAALVALAQIARVKGLDQQTVTHVLEGRELKDVSNEELEALLTEASDAD